MTRTTAYQILEGIDYVMLRDQKATLHRVMDALDAQPDNVAARHASEDLNGILHLIDWIQHCADTEGLMFPEAWGDPEEEEVP